MFKKLDITGRPDYRNNKTPVVILTDCKTTTSQRKQDEEISTDRSCPSLIISSSQKSAGLFVKPCALPPKRKVRVTPLLGDNNPLGARILLSKNSGHCDIKNSSQATDYDSDVQSEFDLNLFKNVARQQTTVKSTPVIKSQNNVREIDRVVEKREGNAAERWQIHPYTPHRQGIVPLRPAFSDCGKYIFYIIFKDF
jgi:hypothetical protein